MWLASVLYQLAITDKFSNVTSAIKDCVRSRIRAI